MTTQSALQYNVSIHPFPHTVSHIQWIYVQQLLEHFQLFFSDLVYFKCGFTIELWASVEVRTLLSDLLVLYYTVGDLSLQHYEFHNHILCSMQNDLSLDF